jgi:hypothetical protein
MSKDVFIKERQLPDTTRMIWCSNDSMGRRDYNVKDRIKLDADIRLLAFWVNQQIGTGSFISSAMLAHINTTNK